METPHPIERERTLLDWLMYWQFRCFGLEKQLKEVTQERDALRRSLSLHDKNVRSA